MLGMVPVLGLVGEILRMFVALRKHPRKTCLGFEFVCPDVTHNCSRPLTEAKSGYTLYHLRIAAV